MKPTSTSLLLAAASLLAAVPSLFAGHPMEPLETQSKTIAVTETEFPFVRGAHEVEFGLGGFASVGTKGTAERPDISYGLAQLNYGWMLSDVHGNGILRGNWELLLGVFGGPIIEGPGDGFAGAELLLRYNFVQPGARLVPFVQIGGGGVYSDTAKDDEVQRLIGSDWSFDLEAALGLRWMFNPRCALSLKAEYRHFSNADTADRNHGLNAIGGVLGVSWLF